MRANNDNRQMRRLGSRRSLQAPRNFGLDIVAGFSAHFVAVSSSSQPGSGKRIFDEIGGGIELYVMRHVALADFSRELLHTPAELFAQRNFVRRQRPRLGN